MKTNQYDMKMKQGDMTCLQTEEVNIIANQPSMKRNFSNIAVRKDQLQKVTTRNNYGISTDIFGISIL